MAGWPCKDYSEHYSGVAVYTQEEADNPKPSTADPDEEPWPENLQGRGGMLVRVSRRRPPPLLEETVSGVYVCPPNSESVRLVFDRSGRLVHYHDTPPEMVLNAMPDTAHYIAFRHFVKICGSPKEHAIVCLLLRMLKDKHMKDLQVTDDTGYWESGDFEDMEMRHVEMLLLIAALRQSLEKAGVKMLDPRLADPMAQGVKASAAGVN